MEFLGRTVLVTGAAGALGGAVARRFADTGANLVLPVRNEERLRTLGAHLGLAGERLQFGIADLTDAGRVREFVDEAIKHFGSIDFLVNAAGGYAGGRLIEEVPVDEWDHLMDVNLKTAFVMCSAVLPTMHRRRFGRIINIAAMAALAPGAKRGPYQVSKRGLITLTETIAEETKGKGITANAIAPSTLLTDANKQSMPDGDSSRWVPPDEIAALILYLCSDEARLITGNTIKM